MRAARSKAPQPARVAVFGANGQTGRLLTELALARGHAVTAFTRHPARFPIHHPELRVVGGEVGDVRAVDHAVAGQDAVLSSLGVPFSRQPVSVYSEGVRHIIAAMRQHGVRRLACVSSSALEPHPEPQGGLLFRKVLEPFFVGVLGRSTYLDQRRMEVLVRSSDLDWTLVRPSGLFAAPRVSDYQVGEGWVRGMFTSRRDLADFLVRQLTDPQFVGKTAAIVTTEGQPSLLPFLWREGIAKRSGEVGVQQEDRTRDVTN